MQETPSIEELLEKKNEEDKKILQDVAEKLLNSGLNVHWSGETREGIGLIVNNRCLIRIGLHGRLRGKFWYIEDKKIKSNVLTALGNKVDFANYTFDIGGPNIGEKIEN